MNHSFWQKWLPVSRSSKGRLTLTIPAFSLPTEAITGCSLKWAEFQHNLSKSFALEPFVNAPSIDYVLCIAWIDLTQHDSCQRYKLWSTGYEQLPRPLYNGETIPAHSVLELWSNAGTVRPSGASTTDEVSLVTTLLSDPAVPGNDASSSSLLTENANIFAYFGGGFNTAAGPVQFNLPRI